MLVGEQPVALVLAVVADLLRADIELLLGAEEGAFGQALFLGGGPDFARAARAVFEESREEVACPVARAGQRPRLTRPGQEVVGAQVAPPQPGQHGRLCRAR